MNKGWLFVASFDLFVEQDYNSLVCGKPDEGGDARSV